jgi:hypothetical protein
MVRLVGLWTEPADIEAFEREYLGTHFPSLGTLAKSQGAVTSRCIDGAYFRMTEVTFATLDDITEALATEAGAQVRSNADELAAKYGITLEVLVVAEAT